MSVVTAALSISESLQRGFDAFFGFIPNLIAFLVILLIGWLIAKALRKITNVVLNRVGFDRAVERGGVGRALERSKYDASGLIAALVYYGVLLIALQFAFGVFGPRKPIPSNEKDVGDAFIGDDIIPKRQEARSLEISSRDGVIEPNRFITVPAVALHI